MYHVLRLRHIIIIAHTHTHTHMFVYWMKG